MLFILLYLILNITIEIVITACSSLLCLEKYINRVHMASFILSIYVKLLTYQKYQTSSQKNIFLIHGFHPL